jgi:hypothetical protein
MQQLFIPQQVLKLYTTAICTETIGTHKIRILPPILEHTRFGHCSEVALVAAAQVAPPVAQAVRVVPPAALAVALVAVPVVPVVQVEVLVAQDILYGTLKLSITQPVN